MGGKCQHPLVFSRDGERKTRLVREFSFNVFNHLMKTRGIRNPLPFKLPHNCGGKNRIAYKLTKSRLIVRPRSPEWVNVNWDFSSSGLLARLTSTCNNITGQIGIRTCARWKLIEIQWRWHKSTPSSQKPPLHLNQKPACYSYGWNEWSEEFRNRPAQLH